MNVSANVPSGTSELEPDEAAAAFLVGQNFYGFQLPSLGQGFNVAGGLTYALPAGDALVIGLGASYQRRGAYAPVAGAGDYDPGDEILLTGGFDYGLSRVSSLALDVTYAIYSADTFGDVEFQSGNAFSVTAKWAGEVGGRRAGLLGRFRTKGETDYLQNVTSPDLVIPTQGRLRAHVEVAGNQQFGLGVFAQGRTYAASDLFDAKALFDLGRDAVGAGVAERDAAGAGGGDVRGPLGVRGRRRPRLGVLAETTRRHYGVGRQRIWWWPGAWASCPSISPNAAAPRAMVSTPSATTSTPPSRFSQSRRVGERKRVPARPVT